jgi:non-heme chloroperoxidase
MSTIESPQTTITDREAEQVERANASGLQPVVFVHGLWLLPNSWDRWVEYFEQAGYVALNPGWPDDPDTVEEAKANPDVLARKGIGEVADHFEEIIRRLDRKPAVMGHSFGGLLTQVLAGRGLSAASVSISPAPLRGVLPLPLSTLRASTPVLSNPVNRSRAVPLTYDQFRYSFANTFDEDTVKELYENYSVPGSGRSLFQSATANIDPWTEAKVDTKNPDRGPMLIIGADSDHTVPPAISKAAYKRQRRNEGVTEYYEFHGRPHALTIDAGWRDVADKALEFVHRYV